MSMHSDMFFLKFGNLFLYKFNHCDLHMAFNYLYLILIKWFVQRLQALYPQKTGAIFCFTHVCSTTNNKPLFYNLNYGAVRTLDILRKDVTDACVT